MSLKRYQASLQSDESDLSLLNVCGVVTDVQAVSSKATVSAPVTGVALFRKRQGPVRSVLVRPSVMGTVVGAAMAAASASASRPRMPNKRVDVFMCFLSIGS